MNVKKYKAVLVAVALLVCFSTYLAVKYYVAEKEIRAAAEIREAQTVYLICEQADKVAVFSKDGKIPIMVLDVYLSSLPYKDRQLIKSGFTVRGYEQLQKVIEDYES